MSWIRLDEDFADHPKVVEAGPLARWLHVKAIGYCNRYLTDGRVPGTVARALVSWEDVEPLRSGYDQDALTSEHINARLIERLVDAGMWIEIEGGYQIHDYLKFQPSRAKVLAEREAERVRKESWRLTKENKRKELSHPLSRDCPGGTDAGVPGLSQQCPVLSDSVSDTDTKKRKKEPSPVSPGFDFESVYAKYPRKEGRKKAQQRFKSQITSRLKYDALVTAVENYAASIADPTYAKHFDTFMGCWEDYIDAGILTPRKVARPSTAPLEPMEPATESKTECL